jgi:hypothetical protein
VFWLGGVRHDACVRGRASGMRRATLCVRSANSRGSTGFAGRGGTRTAAEIRLDMSAMQQRCAVFQDGRFLTEDAETVGCLRMDLVKKLRESTARLCYISPRRPRTDAVADCPARRMCIAWVR